MYTRTELTRAFRQSEILSNVAQYFYNFTDDAVDAQTIDFAVVLSQDCDLIQDFDKRQRGEEGPLNGVMLYEAMTVSEAKSRGMKVKEFEKIQSYGMERYHFLSGVPIEHDECAEGVPDLILDFKKYFTISAVELHWQAARDGGIRRRSRLTSPYLEHIQKRASSYMSRVALPEPPAPSVAFSQIQLPAPKS